MRLHIFGDSHAAYCFDRFEDASINWMGPITMHRAARENLRFVRYLAKDRQADDVIVLIFGEIDVRCHLIPISERHGTVLSKETALLAERYIEAVADFKKTANEPRVVVVQPMFPCDRRPNQDLPFIGSLDQRIEVHALLSESLKANTTSAGIDYLELPILYRDTQGALRRKYSDDGVHIMPCEGKPIAKELSRTLGRSVKFSSSPTTILRRRWNYFLGGSLRRRGLPRAKTIDIEQIPT